MYVVGFSDAVLDIIKKGGGSPFTGSCELVVNCDALDTGMGWREGGERQKERGMRQRDREREREKKERQK